MDLGERSEASTGSTRECACAPQDTRRIASVGWIINFKRTRLEWKRVINNYPKS